MTNSQKTAFRAEEIFSGKLVSVGFLLVAFVSCVCIALRWSHCVRREEAFSFMLGLHVRPSRSSRGRGLACRSFHLAARSFSDNFSPVEESLTDTSARDTTRKLPTLPQPPSDFFRDSHAHTRLYKDRAHKLYLIELTGVTTEKH